MTKVAVVMATTLIMTTMMVNDDDHDDYDHADHDDYDNHDGKHVITMTSGVGDDDDDDERRCPTGYQYLSRETMCTNKRGLLEHIEVHVEREPSDEQHVLIGARIVELYCQLLR